MSKGYWVVRVDIADPEKYKAYVAANAAPLKKHGARFLVRAGKFENPEGASRTRNAVIEGADEQVIEKYRRYVEDYYKGVSVRGTEKQ